MATGGELPMRYGWEVICAVLRSFERHKYKQVTRDIAFRRSKEGSVKPSYIKQGILQYIVNCAVIWQQFWLVRRTFPDIAPRSYFCGLVSRREF